MGDRMHFSLGMFFLSLKKVYYNINSSKVFHEISTLHSLTISTNPRSDNYHLLICS